MEAIKIEVNGLNLSELSEKLEALTKQLQQPTPPTAEPVELITRTEVCKLLNITLPTVSDWSKKRIIKAYRIGNKVRFKKSEILETLTQNLI